MSANPIEVAAENTGHAVINRDGLILTSTIRSSAWSTIRAFLDSWDYDNWKYAESLGYRVARVETREVEKVQVDELESGAIVVREKPNSQTCSIERCGECDCGAHAKKEGGC